MPDRIVRGLNGPRGSALLAGGLLCLVHAVAYSPLLVPPSVLPRGLDVLSGLIPMTVWAVLWAIGVPVCLAAAFRSTRTGRDRHRADVAAWAGLVGMLMAWALGYAAGWVLHLVGTGLPGSERAYIPASLYLCVAIFAGAAARMRNPCDVIHRIEVTGR